MRASANSRDDLDTSQPSMSLGIPPMRSVCRSFFVRLATALGVCIGAASCGGDAVSISPDTHTPATPASFTLSVSPNTLTTRVGGTAAFSVSITPVNGFAGDAELTMPDIPPGVSVSPAMPLAIHAGTTVSVSVQFPSSSGSGTSSMTVRAVHDTVIRSSTVNATVLSSRRAFRDGDYLKLETVEKGDSVVVAVRLSWGASIVEASLNGANFVNAYDPGREVQLSVYGGNYPICSQPSCATVYGNWLWNPVQGGDYTGNGSPVTAWTADSATLYAKTSPIEWYPDYKGGGKGRPIATDVVFEQWISPVPSSTRAFRIHSRVTHTGTDSHALSNQELPAVYTNMGYGRLVTSGNSVPWTGAPLVFTTPPPAGAQPPHVPTSEHWAGLVDANNTGLVLFAPQSFAFVSAFAGSGTSGPNGSGWNYLAIFAPRMISPNEVFEFDYYLVLGAILWT